MKIRLVLLLGFGLALIPSTAMAATTYIESVKSGAFTTLKRRLRTSGG